MPNLKGNPKGSKYNWVGRVWLTCEECRKRFSRHHCVLARSKHVYCSRKCYHNARSKKYLTQEIQGETNNPTSIAKSVYG